MECWSVGAGLVGYHFRQNGVLESPTHHSITPLLPHSVFCYGVVVGLAAGSGVADCSGLGLALLSGDSFGVGEVCAVTR
jgi:hypothetical protein